MTGYESDLPTYPLDCCILCSSATDKWASQILCPSQLINSSKVEDVGVKVFFYVKTRRNWYKSNNIFTIERLVRIGRTPKLVARIWACPMQYCLVLFFLSIPSPWLKLMVDTLIHDTTVFFHYFSVTPGSRPGLQSPVGR